MALSKPVQESGEGGRAKGSKLTCTARWVGRRKPARQTRTQGHTPVLAAVDMTAFALEARQASPFLALEAPAGGRPYLRE